MIEVSILGGVEARVDGAPVAITSRTQRILLAALAQGRGGTVPADRLVWLVWGEDPPASARESLKSHLSRLRRALGPDGSRTIVNRPPGYALDIDPGRIDLCAFEAGATTHSIEHLDAALALWRGDPFGDLADHEHLRGEVTRLCELHRSARLRRAELLADTGRLDEAVAELTGLAFQHPLLEPARTALIATLRRAGRQADAVAEADRYRNDVAEVGLEPSPDFLRVEQTVFAEPHRGAEPSTPTSSTPPVPLTGLIGRDADRERIEDLLDDRRIVTLVGPGGVGKTALAATVARNWPERTGDEVWTVALGEVVADTEVLPAVVRAVGAPTTPPFDRALTRFLAPRRGVLLLDNSEHVTDGACRLVSDLVAETPGVRVLVTGRRPLGLPGEIVVAVEPLSGPEALALFADRCRDAGRELPPDQTELAVAICDRLDRLPLAIEMAAARMRALTLDDLDRHLDLRLLNSGSRGRHRTLHDVIAWSHDLLDEEQQALFATLAVFAGPAPLETIDAIHEGGRTASALADLVDRSLVHVRHDARPGRYHLLETVRSFAQERLAASTAEASTLRRFVHHHVELAEAVADGLRGPAEARWAERFDLDTPNLRAAHARALADSDVDAAIRIAVAPFLLVYQRLRSDIGAWAEPTLEPARRAGHPATAAVLALVALDRLNRGDHEAVAQLLDEVPDDPHARHAHEIRGDLATYRGELDDAVAHFAKAEELAREGGDHATACHAHMSQAIPLGYAGHHDEARTKLRRARAEAEQLGVGFVSAWCDFAEAELLVEVDPARALTLVDRAVAAADAGGWRMLAGVGRLTASSLRARTADPADAVAGFDRLVHHWHRLGDHNHQWTTLRNLVELLVRLEAWEDAAVLLGAVSASPRPTFGPEQQRLHDCSDRIRSRLGDHAEELVALGTGLVVDEATRRAMAALTTLRSAHGS